MIMFNFEENVRSGVCLEVLERKGKVDFFFLLYFFPLKHFPFLSPLPNRPFVIGGF